MFLWLTVTGTVALATSQKRKNLYLTLKTKFNALDGLKMGISVTRVSGKYNFAQTAIKALVEK